MTLEFYKYQGTGNDFIIVDNRRQTINKNDTKRVSQLCDRRFGIGADGFILLENDNNADFKMVYYNADGNESTMCGNGGRCITAFAKYLGVFEGNKTRFMAIDGLHHAELDNDRVYLQMQNVTTIEVYKDHLFLDTGSPHHVEQVTDLKSFDVKLEGSKIRYGTPYGNAGSNVNFVEQLSDSSFQVRTYERGVENETLSCGTGVTAVALAMYEKGYTDATQVDLQTPGGALQVKFEKTDETFTNIWLIGAAKQVFKGQVEW